MNRELYTKRGCFGGFNMMIRDYGKVEALIQDYLNRKFDFSPSFNAILHEEYGEYRFFPEKLLENKEVAIAAVSEKGTFLCELPEKTREDYDVIVAAIRSDNTLSFWLSKDYFDNKEFSLKLIKSCFPNNVLYFLDKLSDRLKDDEDIILAAMSIRSDALSLASDRLKNDLKSR